MHSTGAGKLPFEELPDALQKQYHYDPAKVAAEQQQRARQVADEEAAEQRKLADQRAAEQSRPADQAAAKQNTAADQSVTDGKLGLPATAQRTPLDAAGRAEAITVFKKRVNDVFTRTSVATNGFRPSITLKDVNEISPALDSEIRQMTESARSFRKLVGYKIALRECPIETSTVDALTTLDRATHELKSGNAASVKDELSSFHRNNPGPAPEVLLPLYNALSSLEVLSAALQRETNAHLERASSLTAAGKVGAAIKECEEAYAILPDPKILQLIKEMREQSLGL